ncbi:sulfatase [Coraliomargarita sp. SDUM461004]|uniref:Sulfatase n=1 Tax=Thalassobacterium sedimentorum TaxID=3041258 RepID=A0ABU1AFV8_9BACT|nr:sulfatase [Coraliomargarita sp. SDUM461004]MDQ8193681.1 sulfatase [Coraliomargarita sp. SDUM461004]
MFKSIFRLLLCLGHGMLCCQIMIGIWLSGGQADAASEQPNIILIIADDFGPEMGAYGDLNDLTPNLDALAASGAMFLNGHVTAASCSPSRGSMFTGLYPHQHGMFGLSHINGAPPMHDDVPKLPNELKRLGYTTAIVGKTHFQPFDQFDWDYVETNGQKVVYERNVRWMNEKGFGFIDAHKDSGPLFLVMSYVDPHRGGPAYGPGKNQEFPRVVSGLPEVPIPPDATHPIPYLAVDTPAVRSEISDYYAAVQRLDVGVGEFMTGLDQRLVPENTLIVFIGDHGADVTRGKISAYHSATHIPYLVRWTQHISAGQIRDELVSTIDLFPSFLDAAGAETVKPDVRQTGLSFIDLLCGKRSSSEWREYLFTEYLTHVPWHLYPRYTVFDGRFHYILNIWGDERENPLVAREYDEAWLAATAPGFSDLKVAAAYARVEKPPQNELFDLQKDPFSLINLADNPEYAQLLRQAYVRLNEWRLETKDPFLDSEFLADFDQQMQAIHEAYKKR